MRFKDSALFKITIKAIFPFSSKKLEPEFDLVYGLNAVEAALNANKREFVSLMLSDSDRI